MVKQNLWGTWKVKKSKKKKTFLKRSHYGQKWKINLSLACIMWLYNWNPQSNYFCQLWVENYESATDLQSLERKKNLWLGNRFLEKYYSWCPSALPHIELWPPSSCICKFLEKCKYLDLQTSLTSSFFPTRKLFGKKNLTIEILHIFKHITSLKINYQYFVRSMTLFWYLYNWDLMKLGEKVLRYNPFSS